MLPTTITGSLPRPSWYTENLGTRMFLDAMVEPPLPRAVRRHAVLLSARPGARRARHRDRRRLPLRRRRRRPKLDQLSAAPHERLRARRSAADSGRPRRAVVSARPHPARLPGIAGDADRSSARSGAATCNTPRCGRRRSGSPRSPVKFGAVSAEIVAFASQDRHYKSVPERMLAIADAFNEEYHRARRRRLPGDPDRGAADPPDRGAQGSGQGDHAGLDGRGVQPHGEGLRDKTEVWAHSCWGNPSQQRMFAEVQTYKPSLETYNTIDADVITFEFVKLRRYRSRGDRQDHHRQEDRDRRHRSSHAAGGKPGRGGRANPRRAQIHPARATGDLVRLRHGARGHEPPSRLLQDGFAGARHQHGAQGIGLSRKPNAWRPMNAIRWWCRQNRPSTSSAGEVP